MPNSCITITKVHNRKLNYQHMTEHTKSNFQHLHIKDSTAAFWTCHGAGFVVLFVQVHRVFMCIAKKTKKIGPPFHVWDMKTYMNGWNLWQIHVEKIIPVPFGASGYMGKWCHFQLVSSKVVTPISRKPSPVTSLHSCTDSPWVHRGKVNQESLRFPMSNESDVFSKRF